MEAVRFRALSSNRMLDTRIGHGLYQPLLVRRLGDPITSS